jgi:hypothetical protein
MLVCRSDQLVRAKALAQQGQVGAELDLTSVEA